MKRISTILILLLISAGAGAQEALSVNVQREVIKNALSKDSTQNLVQIDSLLENPKITYICLKDSLIGLKLTYQKDLYRLPHRSERDKSDINRGATEILKTYCYAIDNQIDCGQKGMNECKQYIFLEELVDDNGRKMNDSLMSVYASQRDKMIQKGYIPLRLGIGLGAQFAANEYKWIGVDLSAFSYYAPSNMPSRHTPEHLCMCIRHKSNAAMLNAGTLGYMKALNSPANDFYMSLIELRAPILIIPTRFGFQYGEITDTETGNKKPLFYYRSALGFGLGMVTVSYSYTIPLSDIELPTSRHMFNLGISGPIIDRYRVRRANE